MLTVIAVLAVWAIPGEGRADVGPPVLAPPVPGAPTRTFDLPEHDWLPGHRGVDLAGAPDESVRAAAAGVVTFAGVIAGRGVIVVAHGDYRTTYEPVRAVVTEGTLVAVGEEIGRLEPGHDGCPVSACLHWGLKRGDDYLDPLAWLSGRLPVRLLPRSPGSACGAVTGTVLRR